MNSPDASSSDAVTRTTPPPSRAGAPTMSWMPPTVEHLQSLLPQYEIISMLGHGGMGAVYKGKQKSLDRLVAIKILPPGLDDDEVKFSERFKNEARTMAKLMHPGIVAVFDFGETAEGQLYFVMEYVDGTDVAKMIASQTRLPPEHALAVTAHVCDALAYAHANGVIHRDIKPANILINIQGQVKVADFGLAKVDDPTPGRGLTMTGMAMGTPDFVAPEALISGMNVDGRADLYAIGVMLYQMLTGEIPRGLFQMPSVLTQGVVDPRFDGIITKAMQTDRNARYQAATDIRRDLDAIISTPRIQQDASQAVAAVPQRVVQDVPGQRSIAQRPAPRSPSPKARSSHALVIGVVALVVIGAAFVILRKDARHGTVSASSPAAAAAANTSHAIELLPLIDMKKDVIVGPWSLKDGALIADATPQVSNEIYNLALCATPYTPPEEFDVEIEFTTPEGSQASLMLPLISAGTQVECAFNAGNRDRWHAFDQLDSMPPYAPQRKGEAAFKLTEAFANGRHRARIEVRRASLKMVVDGVTTVDWSGDLKRFALGRDHVYLKRVNRLVIGRTAKPMMFHRLSVHEVSGAGTLLPGSHPAIEPWIDGLAEWWRLMPPGDAARLLTREAGGSRVIGDSTRKAIFPAGDLKHRAPIVRATVSGIADFCAIHIRHRSPSNYQAVLQSDGSTKIVFDKELARGAAIPGFDPTKSHVFQFRADGSTLSIQVDGTETCRVQDDTLKDDGTFYFTGDEGTLIEKLEYR